MTTMRHDIGDRQTVDRAKHPTLGEGRLVHRNGPSFFIADSGEWCALTDVGGGGSSSSPRRSWVTARQDGKRIELEETDRERGDRHDRAHVHSMGTGWLTWHGGEDLERHRFEPDDGKAIEFRAHQLWIGLPEHKDCKQKQWPSQKAAGDAGWRCMSDEVLTIVWCHEADKEKALHYLEHRNDPKPEKAKRGKAPSGPLPDFASMTREQIRQWQEGAR